MSYRHIQLADVMTERREKPDAESIESGDIRIVGKISFAKGKIELRSSSSSKTGLITIHPGDLVVSGINVAKGAIAIHDDMNAGPIAATIHYSTYKVDTSQADIKYLWWLMRSNMFRELLALYVPGGIKTELKAKRLLPVPINLPTLKVQSQIVAKIESLADRVNKAKELYRYVNKDMESLLIAMSHRNDLSDDEKLSQGWEHILLGNVINQVSDPVSVEPDKGYPHFGIYSFSKGLFKKGALLGDEIKATKLYRVNEGWFIYGRLNAYEGAFAVITADYDAHHVSNEFPTFECDTSKILPEFLLAYYSTPVVWEELKRKVTGIGGGAGNRRIRLKEKDFLSDELWLPPIEIQNKIKTISQKINGLKQDRDAVGLQLDALLPSILDRAFNGKL